MLLVSETHITITPAHVRQMSGCCSATTPTTSARITIIKTPSSTCGHPFCANTWPGPRIGNHETYTPLSNGRFPFLDIFTQPISGEAGGVASGTERYYSFDYANIHFVCLDSMTSDRSSSGLMANWLRQDLAANTNDWLIAFFHHPPYTKGSHDSDDPFGGDFELPQMRQNLVPILESYGVDLVLSGHSHIYERSFLLNGHYGRSTTLTSAMVKDSGSGRPEDTGAYLKPTSGPAANRGPCMSWRAVPAGLLFAPVIIRSCSRMNWKWAPLSWI